MEQGRPSFCKYCGGPLAQDAAFCMNCGRPVDPSYKGNLPQNPQMPQYPQYDQPAPNSGKSGKGLLIGLIALAALIVIALLLIIVVYVPRMKKGNAAQTAEAPAADHTEETENGIMPARPHCTQYITEQNGTRQIRFYNESGLEQGVAYIDGEGAYSLPFVYTYDEGGYPQSVIIPTGDRRGDDGEEWYPAFKITFENILQNGTVSEVILHPDKAFMDMYESDSVMGISMVTSFLESFQSYKEYENATIRLEGTEYYIRNENGVVRESSDPISNILYDAEGRVLKISARGEPNGPVTGEVEYFYDENGIVQSAVSVSNGERKEVAFTVNDLPDGSKECTAEDEGTQIVYRYDAQGHLVYMQNGSRTNRFNSFGQLTETEIEQSGEIIFTLTVSYDHERDIDLSSATVIDTSRYVTDETMIPEQSASSADADGSSANADGSAYVPAEYAGSWQAAQAAGPETIELTITWDPAQNVCHCNFIAVRLMNTDFDVSFEKGSAFGTIGANDWDLTGTMELGDGCVILHFDDDHAIYFDDTVSQFLGASELWFYRS